MRTVKSRYEREKPSASSRPSFCCWSLYSRSAIRNPARNATPARSDAASSGEHGVAGGPQSAIAPVRRRVRRNFSEGGSFGEGGPSPRRSGYGHAGGFTLVELLTMIAVIAILASLLLPTLSSAREKGNRVRCASNLRQIGMAIMLFASDNDNHTPSVSKNGGTPPTPWSNGSVPWYFAITNSMPEYSLTNGGSATARIFKCPDDRRKMTTGNTPRSYAIVIGNGNSNPDDFWIAGSRLTCPYLTNSAVAIVGESYSDTVLPTMESTANAYIQSTFVSDTARPSSLHKRGDTTAGNYLFLDGHVEWVQLLSSASPAAGSREDQMFPHIPAGAPSPPCP